MRLALFPILEHLGDEATAISRIHLAYISPTSRLYLAHISPPYLAYLFPNPYLPHVSPHFPHRPHLAHISRISGACCLEPAG